MSSCIIDGKTTYLRLLVIVTKLIFGDKAMHYPI